MRKIKIIEGFDKPGTVPLFMEGHPADGARHQGLYRPGQL